MTGSRRAGGWCLAFAAAALAVIAGGRRATGDVAKLGDPASFLALREIDAPRRAAVASATEWTPAVEAVIVKVLRRLDAPPPLAAGWWKSARPAPAAGEPVAIGDDLLVIRGRATFVAPQQLVDDLAERLGRPAYDVVRIVDERGLVADVLVPSAPTRWPRWRAIDEPATVLALALTTSAAPVPSAGRPAEAAAWPNGAPGLVAAAAAVAWRPGTPLGRLGMDYALFDTVEDGRNLVAGDTAAFFAMLAAVGRSDAAKVAAAAEPVDVLSLIDAGRKWLPAHRGDPVVVEGSALRATRVPIDDAFRRAQVGADHYWELFVFTDTPPLDVDGKRQNSFPIVCCVREIPPGMPVGETMNEPVRVPGFAFKRYAYLFEEPRGEAAGQAAELERRQTTIVIGPGAEWRQAGGASGFATPVGIAAAVGIAALLGLGILFNSWSVNRSIRRSRAELPDQVNIP